MGKDLQAAGPGSGLRILLAEDSRTNQMALRLMLEKEGHRVSVAENGRLALEALRQATFDLVLMDIQMPEMDGVEATRRIREDRSGAFDPRIPVVAITAYAMVGDREKFLAAGIDDYLAKPVMWQDLRAALVRWGGAPPR